jgi:hypothetical protein
VQDLSKPRITLCYLQALHRPVTYYSGYQTEELYALASSQLLSLLLVGIDRQRQDPITQDCWFRVTFWLEDRMIFSLGRSDEMLGLFLLARLVPLLLSLLDQLETCQYD